MIKGGSAESTRVPIQGGVACSQFKAWASFADLYSVGYVWFDLVSLEDAIVSGTLARPYGMFDGVPDSCARLATLRGLDRSQSYVCDERGRVYNVGCGSQVDVGCIRKR